MHLSIYDTQIIVTSFPTISFHFLYEYCFCLQAFIAKNNETSVLLNYKTLDVGVEERCD